MELKILRHFSRSAVLEIADGGRYYTRNQYQVFVNGSYSLTADRTICSLFGLRPDMDAEILVRNQETGEEARCAFHTEKESVTLNVRDFGASGDGETDDTLYLQTAIDVCPKGGRVLVPEGVYKFRCLVLKSSLQLCLEKGAVLSAFTDPGKLPLLPGAVQTYDEESEFLLGTWEGNPLPSYTGIVSGFGAENVLIYGEGILDGCAAKENWWQKKLQKVLPARPRLLFLHHCAHVTVQGITLRNSPSWTIHPYFCEDISFYGMKVENPAISPNTDGLDPESCDGVKIIGMRFSLGDDCIAVKAGKIYMAEKYRTPCRNIEIRQCLLENGHGAVTIGSEMAGGVINMKVSDCLFLHTDRGLRIKTRRGRGRLAVIDDIEFRNITMDHVMTPVVINSFYFCDPDGHTSYVQQREGYEADERTPEIRKLGFYDVECTNCHVQAVYVEGLPEKKIEQLILSNVSFSFAKEAVSGVPAMSEGVEPRSKAGIFISGVKELTFADVVLEGQEGDALVLTSVDNVKGNVVEK